MKKALSIIIVLTVFAASASACTTTGESFFNQKPDYTKSEVNAYPYKEKTPIVFECLFREDLPEIPFVDAEDYLNQLFTETVGFEKGEKGVYTFINDEYSLTVDAENDIIYGESIECFIAANLKEYSDGLLGDYIEDNGLSDEDVLKPFSIDLGKYGIDIAEYDSRVYLPFCTLGDLFADMGCAVLYKDGELFFNSGYDTMGMGKGQGKLEDTRSKAMAEFSYNELCMTMDTIYGLPTMSVLSESIREKGFDKTLLEYNSLTPHIRELLLSEDTAEYCKGVRLLDYYLYDGGHTQMEFGLQRMMGKYSVPGAADIAEELLGKSDPEPEAIRSALRKSTEITMLKNELVAKKNSAYEQLDYIMSEGVANLYRTGDTYFFEFNAFENSVVKPFKEALDYAAANGGKNFVIDLSTNGGGSDFVVNYMLAMMLGEDTSYSKSSVSGSIFKNNLLVDKNLDGEFDEKDDAVSYDLRFAVITSQYSYSNANCMPCDAQDRGIAILGEKSGGGTCNVSPRYYPNGCLYSISGSGCKIHSNGENMDSGTVPDTALPGADKRYEGFYDIDAIIEGINAFYE